MKKILTVIGARPQIIKAAALSRVFKRFHSDTIQELILHTGQHYDEKMSEVFFTELKIPRPDFQLNCGTEAMQLGEMLNAIRSVILEQNPDGMLLYGDTNSTLAGSLAAAKLKLPVFHVEAGMRSFNQSMPEEINRIICDHVSTLLFSPTQSGIENLKNEGFPIHAAAPYSAAQPGVFHCGDVMYDNSLFFSSEASQHESVFRRFGLDKDEFILVTVHRPVNTDTPERLNAIFRSLLKLAEKENRPVILPLHPRTKKMMGELLESELMNRITFVKNFHIIEPASFLEMIALEKNAAMVITDSGGVQKEAFYFDKPCIVLRNETEWVELVNCGAAELADADEDKIYNSYLRLTNRAKKEYPRFYGDGKAAEFIAETIKKQLYS